MDPQSAVVQNGQDKSILESRMHRRNFLKFTGTAAASAALIVTACDRHKNDATDNGINLGSGDIGVLNYAYALEQLEAAFYMQVVANASFGTTFSAMEREFLTDIRDHEVAHREFFKAALGSNAIQALEVDFSSINFANKSSVLNTAMAFEDLGVSAYNGAGKLLTNPTYLLLAGKIVSVEARHAAAIHELIARNSFADPVNASTGLDVVREPGAVLDIAKTYLKSKLNASNLPTS